MVKPLAGHLEQLSAADCDQLLAICRQWSETRWSFEPVVREKERDWLDRLNWLRGEPKKLDEDLAESHLLAEAQRADGGSPDWRAAILDAAAARVRRCVAQILDQLKRPTWERQPPAMTASEELPDRVTLHLDRSGTSLVWSLLGPSLFGAAEPGARVPYDPCYATFDQARARLLACHAGVLRFRWEHDRLPKTLEELRLGPLATDPYSGEPFRYDPRPDDKGHPGGAGSGSRRERPGH
jgi:hypothetical protein